MLLVARVLESAEHRQPRAAGVDARRALPERSLRTRRDRLDAAALPLSVRFVTSTYQSVLEEETPQAGTEKGKEAE